MITLNLYEIDSWWGKIFTAPLFKLGRQFISLLWLVQVLFLLLFVTLSVKGFKYLLKKHILLGLGISEGNREAIATLTSLALGACGYVIILQAMGLDLASLAVIIGSLGIGIGFGLQELIKNLTSGITLLAERKLKVGDLIEFEGTLGHIQEISIRSTVIRTFKGSELIVPNTYLTSKQIENWSYQNRQGRLDIPISVAHNSNPLLVTEILLYCACLEPDVLQTPPPKVVFDGFGDGALSFELLVWIQCIERRLMVKSSLNFIIEYHLRQRGISLAMPQPDFWLHNPENVPFPKQGETNSSQQQTKELPSPLPPSLQQLLQQVTYFQHFNDLQLRRLIEMGYRRHLAAGDVLFQQGEYGNAFCIVLTGAIDAIYETDKISKRLFTFAAGQYFGELPLMLGVPYPTTMRAVNNSTLFLIRSECFKYLLTTYPELAEDIAQELAKRQDVIQDYQKRLREMGLLGDEEMINPVAWLRSRLGSIFNLKLSQVVDQINLKT
jgi:small-conductance mechanosensitive channel/CRP-like cAMP-binding protein